MAPAPAPFSSWLARNEEGLDVYVAAAVHAFADEAWRARLEAIIFATTRDRLRWAGEPFTPPAILVSLARLDDERLNRRLARHERTPADVLERIRGAASAAEDLAILSALAGHRNASADLLRSLPWREAPAIREGLAGNAACPKDLLAEIFPLTTLAERKLMAANPAADEALLQALWDASAGDCYLQCEIAANPSCPLELHDVARLSPAVIVRRKLAENPNVRTPDLIVLLADPASEVRAAAARSAPSSAMDEDDCEPAASVRRMKARRHDLPPALIERLAQDEDSWVRRWLARNPSVGVDSLAHLSRDPEHEVRRGVARNPVCPKDLLAALARDDHPWVRAGVSFRTDIDAEMIKLFEHEENIDVLSGLGRNPVTPRTWLERIAASPNVDLRRSVILNAHAPSDLLLGLAEDPYVFNRVCLLRNPSLPADALYDFLSDPEPQVRFMAAARLAREEFVDAGNQASTRANTTSPSLQRPLKSVGFSA